MNGELAFAEYTREAPGRPYRPLALTVAMLDSSGTHIAEKVSFVSSKLLARLGFPETLESSSPRIPRRKAFMLAFLLLATVLPS